MTDKPDMSERLKKILKENAEFERKSPYNFCDRWCERCTHEKQMRCSLYQDEFEQKITCIAHGRDSHDPEITEEVMRRQFEGVEEKIEQFMEDNDIDLDDIDSPEFEGTKEQVEPVKNHPLDATAKQYCKRTHEFLRKTFYDKKKVNAGIVYDFETIAWYHTLLPAKLHRALCGFYKPVDEDEFGLCDAVAQFAVCKKAIDQSTGSLRKIKPYYPAHQNLIVELSALLHNIDSRIKMLEESIG